tara:strand:+ start:277 stop:585 length:309 start_codon:yes stop_codon:yes gene_type:complete
MDELVGMGLAIFVVGYGIKVLSKMSDKWKKAIADGEISLDEAIELATSIEEVVEEAKSLPSVSAMKRMKKDELAQLCIEHGVDAEGTKALLIEKLKESVKNE